MKTSLHTLQYWLMVTALCCVCHTASAFYNPEQGRWLSRDPIEEQGSLSLYNLAGNDPLSRIDALGQFTFPTFSIPIYFDCPSLSGGCYKCVGKFSTNLPLPRNPQAFQTCVATMMGRMLA